MKKKALLLIGCLSIALIFAITACSSSSEGGSGSVPAIGTSVDDFASQEPAMAPNPSMAIVKQGDPYDISIDEIGSALLDSSYIRSASTNVITVVSLDTDIATVTHTANSHTARVHTSPTAWGSARILVTINGQQIVVNIYIVPAATGIYRVPTGRQLLISSLGGSFFQHFDYNDLPPDFNDYSTEPSHRLAWVWRNPGDGYGLSGVNCGIDIIGVAGDSREHDYGWKRTTFGFGGWFYDLNGVQSAMVNGVQTSQNGVKLELSPEFIYDNGVPYLEITHKLTNTGGASVTGQKFGATADIMLWSNDYAPLKELRYGALMTDSYFNRQPTMKLRLVVQNMVGVDDVDTLWLGGWSGGDHRDHVYENRRAAVSGIDSAAAFSYQNISLAAGESKTYKIRFTIAAR